MLATLAQYRSRLGHCLYGSDSHRFSSVFRGKHNSRTDRHVVEHCPCCQLNAFVACHILDEFRDISRCYVSQVQGFVRLTARLSLSLLNICIFLLRYRFRSRLKTLEEDTVAEEQPASGAIVPEPWPSRGTLHIRGLTVSYEKTHVPALKNINLSIEPGQHLVICGRTGR